MLHIHHSGTFLVTASVGTRDDYSLGEFGTGFINTSPSMRVPLMLANQLSVLVQWQKIHLGVIVKMQLVGVDV